MKRNTMGRFVVIATLVVWSVSTVFAFDFSKLENTVTEHKLKNGLTFLIMERHDAPVVTFTTWANVGSVDDPKGYTGIAHMFEHMAFKGTTTLGTTDIKKELADIKVEDSIFMELRAERNKGRFSDSTKVKQLSEAYEKAREDSYGFVKPNEFGRVIEREGGVGLNAFTSNDATVFFFSLPSNRVELWMSLESERFLHPVLREMYKERDVVAEERRMRIESNPVGKLVEDFLAAAYKAHPYGVPGIGSMSDIQYYSRQEAEAFFQKYYGPSNLVCAVVGDVNTNDVIKLAEKYFGPIPYRPAPQRIATVEPPQVGEHRVIVEDPSQPLYLVGWHVPDATNPDMPALYALIDYLGGGRTSLLYKNLVKEKKIAVDVGAFPDFPGEKYPTMIAAYAFPATGHTGEECETQVLAEVERLKTELLPNEEVEKIKARAKAQFINQLNSNQGLALQLCSYQTIWGDWHEMFKSYDRINKVTAEDIQRVAKEYLTETNRTTGILKTVQS